MLKVISCVAYEHDYAFVLVAALVCVMTSVMTVRLFDRAERLSTELQLSWILLSGMAGGAAIWTTHSWRCWASSCRWTTHSTPC